MLRKLFFVSIVMFICSGSSTQIVVAMVVAFAFLFLHLTTGAYRARDDALLQTISQTCIFLLLWLGLLVKEEVYQDTALENPDQAANFYGFLAGFLTGLPLIAIFVALFAKLGAVCYTSLRQRGARTHSRPYRTTTTSSIPHPPASSRRAGRLQCCAAVENLFDRKRASDDFDDALELALALQPDTPKAEVTAEVRQRQQLTVDGAPFIERDASRGQYLLKLRISAEAIVLRNHPVGKGFVVVDESARGGGRPPYLFIKTWKLTHESKTGMVRVKYDIRDTGRRLADGSVLYKPQEANKELLLWEERRKLGLLGKVAAAATSSTAETSSTADAALLAELGAAEPAKMTEAEPRTVGPERTVAQMERVSSKEAPARVSAAPAPAAHVASAPVSPGAVVLEEEKPLEEFSRRVGAAVMGLFSASPDPAQDVESQSASSGEKKKKKHRKHHHSSSSGGQVAETEEKNFEPGRDAELEA
jgi:hypothetical protein